MPPKRPPPPPRKKKARKGAPSSHWASSQAEPIVPLEKTGRGCAMAMTACFLEAVAGKPQRLFWCLDLHEDARVPVDNPVSSPEYEEFMGTLMRLREALDRQAWGKFRCKVAMALRHTITTQTRGKQKLLSLFTVPWMTDLTVLCGSDPSVGVWRLWPEEPFNPDPDDLLALPETFWVDGVPF